VDRRFIPANLVSGGGAWPAEAVFFFRSKLTLPEGEGRSTRSKLGRDGQRQAFTPAVILFIVLPEAEDKIDPG
jgi:hypothetical protein